MAADEDRELIEPGGKVRLYVEAALAEGARLELSPAQAHYLLHVMRAHGGDRLSVFNGRDGEWLVEIAEISRHACALKCVRKVSAQRDVPDLWLVFSPIKKTAIDYVAQKATELGARVLQPILTRRTIVRRVNVQRMRANAIEAAEQAGRLTVPEVREPVDLLALLNSWPNNRKLLFCDEAGGPPIGEALAASFAGPWAVLTGPEGGFDPTERDFLRASPFVIPASLGPRILRADTAALASLAIWQALCGDWKA